MTESRTWAWVAVGAAGGVAGTYAWLKTRGRRRGKIHRIADAYLVEAVVAEELAERVPGSREAEGRIAIPLGSRGALVLDRAREPAARLGILYRLTLREPRVGPGETLENILAELVSYGLAIPGERFGAWSELHAPGLPLALNFKAPVRDVDIPEPRRPAGHYFKVGDITYADERMLETLEHIPGSEPDGRAVTIPIHKRGTLHVELATDHTLFAEQRGRLYRLDSRLVGVALDDFLLELIQLGLIGWGGEWDRLPAKIAEHPRTGTPPWIPAGHVAILAGETYLDEPVLALLRTRLATQVTAEGTHITWRGRAFQLVPARDVRLREQRGTLYRVHHDNKAEVTDLLSDLVLRRLATWAESSERPNAERAP